MGKGHSTSLSHTLEHASRSSPPRLCVSSPSVTLSRRRPRVRAVHPRAARGARRRRLRCRRLRCLLPPGAGEAPTAARARSCQRRRCRQSGQSCAEDGGGRAWATRRLGLSPLTSRAFSRSGSGPVRSELSPRRVSVFAPAPRAPVRGQARGRRPAGVVRRAGRLERVAVHVHRRRVA